MKRDILIVVDVQRDFVDGALGTKEAQTMLPDAVRYAQAFDGEVIFTMDTHGEDYMQTQEGAFLPVPHCIRGTAGWEIVPELAEMAKGCRVFEKGTFGSTALAQTLCAEKEEIASITLIGLCTDICVVSNALLLKAFMPEMPIGVKASCCAGVTPEKHDAAIETMKSCQIIMQ